MAEREIQRMDTLSQFWAPAWLIEAGKEEARLRCISFSALIRQQIVEVVNARNAQYSEDETDAEG